MNLGMDNYNAATPPAYKPGIGLRPGVAQVTSEIEETVPVLYAALYDSIAVHSRHGLNVVVDAQHHDSYSKPRRILPDCARRLLGIPVLFVGVMCPIDVIWSRRDATWGHNQETAGDDIVAAVELRQTVCHEHGVDYDLEVDTSKSSPRDCVELIRDALAIEREERAFEKLARRQRSYSSS